MVVWAASRLGGHRCECGGVCVWDPSLRSGRQRVLNRIDRRVSTGSMVRTWSAACCAPTRDW